MRYLGAVGKSPEGWSPTREVLPPTLCHYDRSMQLEGSMVIGLRGDWYGPETGDSLSVLGEA